MKRLHKMEMPKVEGSLLAVFGNLGSANEWLLATALLSHSGGTFLKTFAWSNKA